MLKRRESGQFGSFHYSYRKKYTSQFSDLHSKIIPNFQEKKEVGMIFRRTFWRLIFGKEVGRPGGEGHYLRDLTGNG